mgnify:CR=1 FL=1
MFDFANSSDETAYSQYRAGIQLARTCKDILNREGYKINSNENTVEG